MPSFLNTYGYSYFEIGVLFSIIPIIRFITPFLFIKYLTLDFGFIFIAIVINIISIAMFYMYSESFWLLCVTFIIFGFSSSQILPFVESTTADIFNKDKYGKIRLYGSIGFIVSSLLIPKFLHIDLFILHSLSFFSFFMYLGLIVLFFLLKSDTSYSSNCDIDKFSMKKIWTFWVSIMFLQMSFGGFYNFFTIYASENGISLETISYIWTFGVICEILMLYFQKPILKKISLQKIMEFCILITAIRWIIVFVFSSSTFAILASQSLHAFSFALFHSASIFFVMQHYKNKKLAQQFYLGISFGIGGFLGAQLAGFLYGEYLFLFESILALVSLVFLVMGRKKSKQS